ncbi:dol-P-Glc:Glc(2)Man(9)GlcNAc(2)-PP-Dol alpha-1,2-glucosyltransferase isoform X1 [Primulina tabacum]|uniref:dol-P-Glc:Glc(2)Man(9)GlcNAc(2)-PP-Dol alpha-1,2-glucosyltransferase isoform X1 n=1 Tax=Primulina tabacum TaxID=48773 RepID=UPI003F5A35E1
MGRVAVAAAVSLWLIPISILVNRIVPDPYMDEIFHVPQAQKYCGGNFGSWDPMITTPPGLYVLSLAYVASLFPGLYCLRAVSSFSDSCSTSILRLTNGVLTVVCSILIYELITHLRPSIDDKKATLCTLVLSLYPLHWFFSFLYYTDVASLTAVLAMYLFSLKKKYFLSSLLGALSVLMRQTNIIWMLFVACAAVIDFTHSHKNDCLKVDKPSMSKEKDTQPTDNRGASVATKLRKRRNGNGLGSWNNVTAQASGPTTCSSGLFDEIWDVIIISWHFLWELLATFSPFFGIFMAFVAFVCWNGSIVLGAKDAHSVSPHFSQLLYYSLVSALFTVPAHFSLQQAAVLFRQLSRNKMFSFFQSIAALTICFLSVKIFSIAHPYLLADNRHYPFYLWRKIVNYHWSTKYLMVPLYVYSMFSIVANLAKGQKKIWVMVYILACAGALIPTPLIEFRYYTVPFYFLILHTCIDDNKSWLILGTIYVAINCFTMFMFLFQPFSWSHEAGTQRLMW